MPLNSKSSLLIFLLRPKSRREESNVAAPPADYGSLPGNPSVPSALRHGREELPFPRALSRSTPSHRLYLNFFLEPMRGVEPPTSPLRRDCSAIELHRRYCEYSKTMKFRQQILFINKWRLGPSFRRPPLFALLTTAPSIFVAGAPQDEPRGAGHLLAYSLTHLLASTCTHPPPIHFYPVVQLDRDIHRRCSNRSRPRFGSKENSDRSHAD